MVRLLKCVAGHKYEPAEDVMVPNEILLFDTMHSGTGGGHSGFFY